MYRGRGETFASEGPLSGDALRSALSQARSQWDTAHQRLLDQQNGFLGPYTRIVDHIASLSQLPLECAPTADCSNGLQIGGPVLDDYNRLDRRLRPSVGDGQRRLDRFRWAVQQKASGTPFDPASVLDPVQVARAMEVDIAAAYQAVTEAQQRHEDVSRQFEAGRAEETVRLRAARDAPLREAWNRRIADAVALPSLQASAAALTVLAAEAQRDLDSARRGWGRTLRPYKAFMDFLVSLPELPSVCDETHYLCSAALEGHTKAGSAKSNWSKADRMIRPEVSDHERDRQSIRWAVRQKATGVPFDPASIMSRDDLGTVRAQDVADAQADLGSVMPHLNAATQELQRIADEAERVRLEAEKHARQVEAEARRQAEVAAQAERDALAAQRQAAEAAEEQRRADAAAAEEKQRRIDARAQQVAAEEEQRRAQAAAALQVEADRKMELALQAQRDAVAAEQKAEAERVRAEEKAVDATEARQEATAAGEEAAQAREDAKNAQPTSASGPSMGLFVGLGLLAAAVYASRSKRP